jgi:hypothetical protein
MANFNQNGATLDAKWLVSAHVRTVQPESFWIATTLIFKNTIDNKEFFTSEMPVRIEINFAQIQASPLAA